MRHRRRPHERIEQRQTSAATCGDFGSLAKRELFASIWVRDDNDDRFPFGGVHSARSDVAIRSSITIAVDSSKAVHDEVAHGADAARSTIAMNRGSAPARATAATRILSAQKSRESRWPHSSICFVACACVAPMNRTLNIPSRRTLAITELPHGSA